LQAFGSAVSRQEQAMQILVIASAIGIVNAAAKLVDPT
jgi:hypothetical protein